jgi:hypothetical protein
MSLSVMCITPSLVDDPQIRHNLEKWTESFETHAGSICAMHDVTGALTLVMTDEKWGRIPVNLTTPVNVAADQPRFIVNAQPTLRPQITPAMPRRLPPWAVRPTLYGLCAPRFPIGPSFCLLTFRK